MPSIRSANPDFKPLEGPSTEYGYIHGAEKRQGPIPLAFQVTSPFDRRRALLPHALVMHVNPSNLSESFNKKIERIQTRGGWVEQHWFDESTEMSADGSTGAFVNIYTGLTSVLRQRTIAWDRYRDLYDLFHNNGSVYDPYGAIVLQGNIMLLYDRGIYIGTFRSFDVEETDDSPFAFKISWTFKVRETILKIPGYTSSRVGVALPHPSFQDQNALQGKSSPALSMDTAQNRGLAQSAADAVASSKSQIESASAVSSFADAPAKPRPAPNNPNRSAGGSKAPVAAPTTSTATEAPVYNSVELPPGTAVDAGGNPISGGG